MEVVCVVKHATKHISEQTVYTVKQESKDGKEHLVTNDKNYVVWISKAHFIELD